MNWLNWLAQDKMRWDEMRWDEMRWDEMRWDEMRWDEMARDEMRWQEMRWDGKRWDEMAWDGMEWLIISPSISPILSPPIHLGGGFTYQGTGGKTYHEWINAVETYHNVSWKNKCSRNVSWKNECSRRAGVRVSLSTGRRAQALMAWGRGPLQGCPQRQGPARALVTECRLVKL